MTAPWCGPHGDPQKPHHQTACLGAAARLRLPKCPDVPADSSQSVSTMPTPAIAPRCRQCGSRSSWRLLSTDRSPDGRSEQSFPLCYGRAFPGYGKPFPDQKATARVGVPQVMHAYVLEPGLLANDRSHRSRRSRRSSSTDLRPPGGGARALLPRRHRRPAAGARIRNRLPRREVDALPAQRRQVVHPGGLEPGPRERRLDALLLRRPNSQPPHHRPHPDCARAATRPRSASLPAPLGPPRLRDMLS